MPQPHTQSTAAIDTHQSNAIAAPVWRKILYEPQPHFSDNYTPDDFLTEGVTRSHRQLQYSQLAVDASIITLQSSVIVLYLLTFRQLQLSLADDGDSTSSAATWLTLVDLLLLDAGAVIYRVLTGVSRSTRIYTVFRCTLLLLLLALSSPLIHTLTGSYSSDTVYTLVATCLLLHLITFDYSYIANSDRNFSSLTASPAFTLTALPATDNSHLKSVEEIQAYTQAQMLATAHDTISNTISLNAGMFAAVLLASRLSSSGTNDQQSMLSWDSTGALPIFSFLFLSFELFAGLPLVSVVVRAKSVPLHCSLVAVVVTCTMHQLLVINTLYAVVYGLLVSFTTVIAPAVFIHVLQYKEVVHGRWDIIGGEEDDIQNI